MKDWLRNLPRIGHYFWWLDELAGDLDIVKSRLDVPDDLFEAFQRDRADAEYQAVFDRKDPLVSVCIGTYNRGELLVDRAIKSILGQSYRNFELIVVGDACTDDTAERLSRINDSRVRFVNLPERGKYPDRPEWRWMVAGTATVNQALDLARGDFITHLDDDDEHSPERLAELVRFAQEKRSDIVWHPFWIEETEGRWKLKQARYFGHTQLTTSSVLYHRWFRRLKWDPLAYMLREPGDWNRFRKFKYLGASACRYPQPMLKHYRERRHVSR